MVKIKWNNGALEDKIHMHWVKRETVGQFTGLLDKNKKMIFEWDIVVSYANAFKRVVIYDKVIGGFQPFVGDKPIFYSDGSEVIGNIHDEVTK